MAEGKKEKSSRVGNSKLRSAVLSVLPYLGLLVIALTLVVYPTPLNPGLPLAASGLFLVLVGLSRVAFGSGKYYNLSQDLAVGLLLWLGLCHWMTDFDTYLGAKSLYTFSGGVAMLVACQLGVREASQLRKLCWAFFTFCFLVSIGAWVEVFPEAVSTGSIAKLQGRFVNPDTFSVLPMLGVCVGLGLVERSSRKFVLPLCGAIGILLLTVLATGCRAAIIALLVGGFVFALLATSFSSEKLDQTKYLITVPILICLVVLPLAAFQFSASTKYLKSLTTYSSLVDGTRSEVNIYAWKTLMTRPILGSGPGNFGLSYQSLRPPGHDYHYIDIAHNDFLEMLVEGGIPGLVFWLACWFMVSKKLFGSSQKGRRTFLASALLAALVSVAVFSLFNFILPERPVLWAFLFLLGLGASFPSRRAIQDENRWLARLVGGFLVALGVLSCGFGLRAVKTEAAVTEARAYSQNLMKEQAVERLDQAISLDPRRVDIYLRAAKYCKSLYRFTQGREWSEKERAYLQAAVDLETKDTIPMMLLADSFQGTQEFSKATALLDQAAQLAPHSHLLREKRTSLYIREGKFKEALSEVGKVVDGPDHKKYRQLRGLLMTVARDDPEYVNATLGRWLKDPSREAWAQQLNKQLLERSLKEKRWKIAESLLNLAEEYEKDATCVRFARSQVVAQLDGEKRQYEFLKSFQSDFEAPRESCGQGLLSDYLRLYGKFEGEKALRAHLKSQVDLVSGEPTYRLALSEIYQREGNLKQAQRVLRGGLDRGGQSEALLLRLGIVYQASGSKTLAAGYFREVLKLNPKNSIAKQRLNKVLK